jgi:hypothetical protein
MDKNHREAFHNILLGLHLMFHESFGTEREYNIMHIILEVQRLSEKLGAERHEYMGILVNVGLAIQERPLIDIDKYIEDMKLYEILRDVNL